MAQPNRRSRLRGEDEKPRFRDLAESSVPATRDSANMFYDPREEQARQYADTGAFSQGAQDALRGRALAAAAGERLAAEVDQDAAEEGARRQEMRRRLRDEREIYGGQAGPRTIAEVDSVGDAVSYGAYQTGSAVADLAPSIAASLGGAAAGTAVLPGPGTVSGAVGGFLGGFASEYPAIQEGAALRQYLDPDVAEQPAERRLAVTRQEGAAGAAVGSLLPAAVGRIAGRAAAGGVSRAPWREMAADAVLEGGTEIAQEEMGLQFDRSLGSERERDPISYADAGIAGFLGGAAVGAPLAHAQSKMGEVAREDGVDLSDELAEEIDVSPDDQPASSSLRSRLSSLLERSTEPLVLGDNDPSLAGTTEEETINNIRQRDRIKPGLTKLVAEGLKKAKSTPEAVKEQLNNLTDEDFASPETQAWVGEQANRVRMSNSVRNATKNFVQSAKSLAKKAKGRKKQSLFGLPGEQRTQIENIVLKNMTETARRDEGIREQLPDIANAVSQIVGRYMDDSAEGAESVGDLMGMRNAMEMFEDPSALADQIDQLVRENVSVEQDGTRRDVEQNPFSEFLKRVNSVTSAQEDAAEPNSFMYSALTEEAKDSVRPSEMKRAARMLDEIGNADERDAERMLSQLSPLFGGRRQALSVAEFYRRQNGVGSQLGQSFGEENAAPDQHNDQGIDELDVSNLSARFRDNNINRPFDMNDPREAAEFEQMRQFLPNAREVPFSEYVAQRGEETPQYAAQRVREDLNTRSRMAKERVSEGVRVLGEEMSAAVERARQRGDDPGEITQMETVLDGLRQRFVQLAEKEQRGASREDAQRRRQTWEALDKKIQAIDEAESPEQALSNYRVLLTDDDGSAAATDEDLTKYRQLLKKTSATSATPINRTRIRFKRKNGKNLVLSAESMVHNSRSRSASTADRLSESISAVLAREDIAGLAGPIPDDLVVMRGNRERGTEDLTFADLTPKASEGRIPSARNKAMDEINAEQLREAIESGELSNRVRGGRIEGLGEEDSAVILAANQIQQRLNEARAKENWEAVSSLSSKRRVVRRELFSRLRDIAYERFGDATDTAVDMEDSKEPSMVEPGAFGDVRDEQAVAASSRASAMGGILDLVRQNLDPGLEIEGWVQNQIRSTDGTQDREARNFDEVTGAPTRGTARRPEQGVVGEFQQGEPEPEPKRRFKPTTAPGRQEEVEARMSPEEQEIYDEIVRMRGQDVEIEFRNALEIGAAGDTSFDPETQRRLIRVAIDVANPRSTAFHESMHDFFNTLGRSREEQRVKDRLINAANSVPVMNKLGRLLQDHPDALRDAIADPEERLAYMFQFWAEGELELGKRTGETFTGIRGLLNRLLDIVSDAMANVHERLGTVSSAQQTERILRAFHGGAFSDPSTVTQVLEKDFDLGQTIGEKTKAALGPIGQEAAKLIRTAGDQLRSYKIPELNEIADLFDRPADREQGELGLLQARYQAEGRFGQKLQKILKGKKQSELQAAERNMLAMKKPQNKLERDIKGLLQELYEYADKSGVQTYDPKSKEWRPMGYIENYYPRTWSRSAIMKNRDKFQSLLKEHIGEEQAEATIAAITNSGDGRIGPADSEHHLGHTPWAEKVENRKFTFINESNAEDFLEFMEVDMVDNLMSYIKQIAHRGEYAKRFDNNGEKLDSMLTQAFERENLSEREQQNIRNTIAGLEGSIRTDMNPKLKEIFGGVMSFENVVLLPMALFSQLVDPMGVAIRSNKLGDAGKTYLRALKDLGGLREWARPSEPGVDYERELAEMAGIISADSMLEASGQTYGSMYMSKRWRSINRQFFKYNGMQGFNESVRIAATAAGERYIIRHGIGENSYSEARLRELGLSDTPLGTVELNGQNRLAVSPEQIREAFPDLPEDEVLAASDRIQSALFRFVDGGVVRPNAAQRPTWMSDPLFILVAHLKQFAFSFQQVIMRRAFVEAKNYNNYAPMAILASYIPIMAGVDMAKWALTNDMPSNWGFRDYMSHAVGRSGILGKGEFAADASDDSRYGRIPGESLLGPTFEHMMTFIRGISGGASADRVIDRSIPFARFATD